MKSYFVIVEYIKLESVIFNYILKPTLVSSCISAFIIEGPKQVKYQLNGHKS